MLTTHLKIALSVGLGALAVMCFLPESKAQSRQELRIDAPGLLRPLADTGINRFSAYSYGLGALRAPAGGADSGVLRSSISSGLTPGAGAFSIARSSWAGFGPHLGGATGRPSSHTGVGTSLLVGAAVPAPAVTGATTDAAYGRAMAELNQTPIGSAQAYLQAIAATSVSQLKGSTKPITSLVPDQPSMYRDYMAKGDSAFRAQNFLLAFTYFQIASDIGRRDPESLICLTHTQFALSQYSYGRAAYFLEQAIRRMPELPVVNLRPEGFYGNVAKYAEQVVALEDYVTRSPHDGDALLLLAYLRWFRKSPDVEVVRSRLSDALAAGLKKRDTRLVDAIETFWDGALASGKVSGKLKPGKGASAKTRPARGGAASAPAAAKPAPGGDTKGG